MATVSGVLSADQITSLIQQASTAFQAPANALQAQEKPVQAKISALGQVQGAVSSLQSSLAALADIQSLTQRSVTTSPTGVVQATATNAAATGTYTLSNIQLAHAESLLSSGFASASASLGVGSLAIAVGGGAGVTIDVASGQDTLNGVAAAINQANAGVAATVLFDGSSYYLQLTGDMTGAANSFTVSGSAGLTGLSYSQGASGMTQTTAASDAQFSLNGLAVTSGSNSVSGVAPGLTFTLAASGSATVSVTQDVSALDQAATGLVAALNGVLDTINQNASYDPTSGAGPLLGDIGLTILRSQLFDAVLNPTSVPGSGGGAYTSLASIGFSVTSGGAITLDDAAFQQAAQSDYGAVAALLGNSATATNANVAVTGVGSAQAGSYDINVASNDLGVVIGTVNGQAASGTDGLMLVTGSGPAQGLALQIASAITGNLGTVSVKQGLYGALTDLVGRTLASGGGVGGELDALNKSLASMDRQIAQLQQQAQQETLALTKQYSAAQATLTQLQTVSSFLSTYFAQTSAGSRG